MIDFTELVEPRVGQTVGRWISFSSACRPFGMVNLSPDTRVNGDWSCGYNLADSEIVGISHIHDWQVGGILVMPVVGAADPTGDPTSRKARFDRSTEICKPEYHKLYLTDSKITTELTSTLRVGVHRYTFPANSHPAILIDLTSTCGPCAMGPARLVQTSPRTFEGFITNLPTVRKPKNLIVHFVIELDADAKLSNFDPAKVQARIDLTSAQKPVTMKVAISYTSLGAAKANLRAEASGKSFDDIREESRREWNQMLSRIEVEGGTPDQFARFYTDLFYALVGRRTCSDYFGTYIDNTGPSPIVRQIPLDESGQPTYRHFHSDAFWGAQWSIIPLWLIAYPEIIDSFCRCFMDIYRNGGLIPRGPTSGNDTFVMTSAQSTPLFVAAMNQGVYRPENPHEVYAALYKNHFPGGLMSKCGYEHNTCIGGGIEDYIRLGYIPEDLPKAGFHNNGAGQTIEHSWNDWTLAQLARELGKIEDAKLFENRSHHWRNLFDPSLGFCRPKNRDGSWLEPFSPWSRKGWTEANAFTFTFHCPHDVPMLIDAFGSKQKMLDRLEEAFSITREMGYFVKHENHEKIPLDFGNEPALCSPWFFHLAGEPDRTQFWVRTVQQALKSGNAPANHYGGDEDQGIMAAWNVLVSIGLFSALSACDKNGTYQIGSPIFNRVTIHLNRDYFPGQQFIIEAKNNADEIRYVRGARWNDSDLPGLEIMHRQIVGGGTLSLVLGK